MFKPNALDIILTNPPFGSDLSDKADLSRYQLGKGKILSTQRNPLYRTVHTLVETRGGRLGIIIEDSVLNGASNEDVRQFVLQHCVVEAVISLPDVTFMPYSSSKTSILFLRKKNNNQEAQSHIFMATVEQIGRKQNGDPLYTGRQGKDGSRELLSELPDVVNAWQNYIISGVESITHLSPKIFVCPPERFTVGCWGAT